MPNPSPTYVRLDDNGLLYLLTLLEGVIPEAGDVNAIEIVKKNGVALAINPQDKSVDVIVPTDSDIESLITAHGYQTEAQVQQLIDDELAGITGIDFQIVSTLPASGVKGVIYLVGDTAPYDEYIWIEPTGGTAYFEQIGSTSIDLSGYVQDTEMHALTNAEIDTIFQQVFGS